MFEIASGILASVFSGGATGLIGVGLQQFFAYKQKQQDIEIVKLNLENSLQLAKIETERVQLKSQGELQVAQVVAEGATNVAEEETTVRTFEASVENDSAKYTPVGAFKNDNWATKTGAFMLAFVDAVRGITRPAMTWYLCGLTSAMFYWSSNLAAQKGITLDSTQVVALIQQVISTVLYVFTTAAVWWFGSRPQSTK
jgi:hypothetical protein